MSTNVNPGRMIKAAQKLAGLIGIGLISTEDPDYMELCAKYRTVSLAHQRGDITTILTTLDRDFKMVRPDGIAISRKEVEEQLRNRLENQVQTDYREEPAHMVIRGKKASVASRIYSTTIIRKGDKLIELKEQAEHLTNWQKTSGGWVRIRTRIRVHVQNTEWLELPANAMPAKIRNEKFLI